MTGDQTGTLLKKTKAKDFQALAKLLSHLERRGPKALSECPELVSNDHMAFRFGITGPPGAGKSSLVNRLIKEFRSQNLSVGVIAIDPSSPFSKGAVLGDRIRYTEHFSDPKVFIRSLASRGSLGGLSSSAYLMVRAFDLAGFDVVLIETVGVGQTELEVIHIADLVGVVLVPESGDSIQGMKAGLLEIADLYIVNKSDRPGADSFRSELEMAMSLDMRPGVQAPKIISTSALTGEGIPLLLQEVMQTRESGDWRDGRNSTERLQAEARALLRHQIEREIALKATQVETTSDLAKLFS